MRHLSSRKLEIFLTIFSLLLLIAFHAGLLNKEYDLLDPTLVKEYKFKSPREIKGSVSFANNSLTFTCERPSSHIKITCGATLLITGHKKKGVDFSNYDYIVIQAKTESPAAEDRVRISFKNFNDNYSYLDDDLTYKVNAFLSQKLVGHNQRIPLGLLRVQQWWLNMFKIPLEHSLPDISNVVDVDFLAMQLGPAGTYKTTITQATLHGTYLTQSEVLTVVIICSLIIISLVFREAKLNKTRAITDPLTSLLNREGMQMWLKQRTPSKQHPIHLHLFFLDVDDFKKVNDTHGHKIGDDLLVYLSETIMNHLKSLNRPRKTWGYIRLSGDEFLIIFTDIDDAQAQDIAESVIEAINKPVQLEGANIKSQISMGIVSDIIYSTDLRKVIEKADSAMYVAKSNGKGQYSFYENNT